MDNDEAFRSESERPVSAPALLLTYFAVFIAAISGVLGVALQRYPRANIPVHMTGHSVLYQRDLLDS